MNEVKISDSLSYIFNEYDGEWEPIFYHRMDYYLKLECPICHRIYPVLQYKYDTYPYGSSYRICSACYSRGWRAYKEREMNKIREVFGIPKTNDTSSNEEETIMPFGKTNFGELTFMIDTNSVIREVVRKWAKPFDIEKVIFNAPATIVKWLDGSKTVVKCGENDEYDPEKGLAMCFAKKALGNKGHYYETFKEWLPEDNLEETLKDLFLKKMMNAFESGDETDGK